MKTKMNYLKTLGSVLLTVIALTGCTQSKSTGVNSATSAGVEVEAPDMPLQAAILSGNLQIVKQHIDAGSNINEKDALSGSTPLITASTFNKIEITQTLINAGADLEATNNDGATALHAAAFFCQVEIVQLLIDANADKTIKNNYGATARESVMGPFAEVKPIYEMMQLQLGPLGLHLDLNDLEKTRPVIATMLQ